MVNNDHNELKVLKTGTTTVGLKTNEFVIIAADKQSTLGNVKNSIVCKKVHPITKNVAISIAGSVGDAFQMIRILKMQASLYENERNKKISGKAVVTLTSNILNSNRYYPYMISFIVGGYINSPELYSTDAVGGAEEIDNYTSTGSGSDYAVSVLDNKYKENLTKDQAIKLVCEAINASKKRDIYTGGKGIDLLFIDKKGIEYQYIE